jgi:NifU-like protein involved in Fe-S cluster formation
VTGVPRYSEVVRRLFATAPHSGSLPAGPGARRHGEAMALDRAAWVRFDLRLYQGRVADARFRAWGCPHLLAACALVAERMVGQTPAEAVVLDAAALARELDAPPEKLGRFLVLEDALHGLAAGMREAQ